MWLLALLACSTAPIDDAAALARVHNMYGASRTIFPSVDGISATELKLRGVSDPSLVLVDVRPAEERSISVIPGSISIHDFENHPEQYRQRTVVTYCTIGARSGRYALGLQRDGWDVKNLEGSLLAWTHIDGELVDSSGQPTKRVHVYGRRWNLVAQGYESVW
jgi:rhodanese-related sulfurtransferase